MRVDRTAWTSSTRRIDALPVGGAGGLRQRRRLRRAARAHARGTSRCRSSATAPAPSATSGSATAASSAATRSWSRSRPRPACRPACATASTTAAVALAGDVALRQPRHVRVPGRRRRPATTTRPSPSSRPTRACRSSTPSPKRSPASTWCGSSSQLAGGRDARRLGLPQDARPGAARLRHPGRASTWRRCAPTASRCPSGGTLDAFEPPPAPASASTPSATPATRTSARFDSLLAKVIVHSPSAALRRRRDAAPIARSAEFRIEGVTTNISLPAEPARAPGRSVAASRYTRFVDDHLAELVGDRRQPTHLRRRRRRGRRAGDRAPPPAAAASRAGVKRRRERPARGARLRQAAPPQLGAPTAAPAQRHRPAPRGPDGTVAVDAPLQGTVVAIDVQRGRRVRRGPAAGRHGIDEDGARDPAPQSAASCGASPSAVGDTLYEGHALSSSKRPRSTTRTTAEDGRGRPRRDPARPRRRSSTAAPSCSTTTGPTRSRARARPASAPRARTSTTSVDPGTFVEYGAARPGGPAPPAHARGPDRRRRPADGMITGVGSVNGDLFDDPAARCADHGLRLHRLRRHAGRSRTTARPTA